MSIAYRRWNGLSLSGIALAAAGLLVAGCGDGSNCIDVVVTVLSPASGAEVSQSDDTGAEDGIQIEVTARIDGLQAGDQATLRIVGPEGTTDHDSPAIVDANGQVTFAGVTVPPGNVSLEVHAVNDCDDEDTGTTDVFVVGDLSCTMVIANSTVDTDFYTQPVLNQSVDGDANTAGFQATVEVTTEPGFQVELFVLDVGQGAETSAGTITAGSDRLASFDLTLAEGLQALRAHCVSGGGGTSGSAPSQTFMVDTEAPACAITAPGDGASIIPTDDIDPGTDDTQVALTATVTGGDTEGEPATFQVATLDVPGSDVDAAGNTGATATFSSPGAKTITVSGRDHAENPCTDSVDVNYVTEGCAITIDAPTGTVTTDADAGTTGFQVDVQATIDSECVGQTATTTCDSGGAGMLDVTVPSGGVTIFGVTACDTDGCTISYACTVEVTSPTGIKTSEALTITADNEGPGATVQVTGASGGIACGTVVGDVVDVDPGLSGTQVDVRLLSPFADSLAMTQNGAPVTLDGIGAATITLADGLNSLVGTACDALGNCDQHTCDVTWASLPVNFSPPFVDAAVLGGADGTATAGALDVDVCGTVGAAGATVTLTITPAVPGGDGPAMLVGTDWCRAVTLPEPGPYQLRADATAGPSVGFATVSNITVDVTPPDPPTGMALAALDREQAEVSWQAPGDGGAPVAGYVIRYHTAPLDASNFDTDGTGITAPAPASPGTPQTATRRMLRPGQPYYFAMASLDAVGNRSPIVSDGPLLLDFTPAALAAPSSGTQFFGNRTAGGDVNDDGFSDLIVGAFGVDGVDGVFHVYLGSATGLPATPTFTFHSMSPGDLGLLGFSVAVADWNGDNIDDIVAAGPRQVGGTGRVSIFFGGSSFDPALQPQSRSQADADVQITTTGNGFLAGAAMGFGLATTRFNGDSRDDLLLGMPGANGSHGAAVVLLGGSSATDIVIDDTDAALLNGAKAWQILLGGEPTGCKWGNSVFALGTIDGAADTLGDIGIAGSPSSCGTMEQLAFIIRGRAEDPAGGLAELVPDYATDLKLRAPATGATGFGARMASVATTGGARTIAIAASSLGGGTVYLLPGTTSGGSPAAVDVTTVASATLTATSESKFGSALANSARGQMSDVDSDGFEDLLIAGGSTTPALFVWYGPGFPTGTSDADTSADYSFAAGTGLDSITWLTWVGDVNNDGLEDICWSDSQSSSSAGAAEVLY